MRRRVVLAAGTVSLLLAAASGVYVLDDVPRPAASDDESRTAAFPPGLSAGGVTNTSALVHAHRTGLATTSYAYTRTVTVRHANGTPAADWGVPYEIAAHYRTYHAVQTANASFMRVRRPESAATWSNGTVTLLRIHAGDRAVYHRVGSSATPGVGTRLYALFLGLNTTLDAQTLGAPFTVHAETKADVKPGGLGTTQSLGPVRNVSFTAEISGSGVVESYTFAYTTTFREERVHVVERYELTARGIDVTKPAWVDEALGKTTE